jgi:hypothetical protein
MCKYRFRLSSLLLVAATLAGATSAEAQSVCGNRAKFIATLAQKYEEMPAAFGIAGEKNLVELFVSKSGSWTMLMSHPTGMTCIIATGQSWEQFPPSVKTTGL